MGAFNATTTVPLQVQDPLTDKTPPPPASLSYQQITSTTGLAGTNGSHADLVHGNQYQAIDNNLTSTIGGNQNHTVSNNQTTQVDGDKTSTVGGNSNTTNQSNTTETTVGDSTEIHVGSAMITYTNEWKSSLWTLEVALGENVAYAEEVYIIGLELGIIGVDITLTPLEVTIALADITLGIVEEGAFAFGDEAKALKASLKVMEDHLHIAEDKLTGARSIIGDVNITGDCNIEVLTAVGVVVPG
ncbi:MAG: bacteriophage T4 gp5 trimerization domain-containing protein [Terriglobia bacterium]